MPGHVNCTPLPTALTRPTVLTWFRTPVADDVTGADVTGGRLVVGGALVVTGGRPVVGGGTEVRAVAVAEVMTPPVQATPLSAKLVGTGLAEVQEPLNPKDARAPAPRFPFQVALVTVTWVPDWATVPFHSWVTVWPAANDQVSRQLVSASPRLSTSTLAPNP